MSVEFFNNSIADISCQKHNLLLLEQTFASFYSLERGFTLLTKIVSKRAAEMLFNISGF